MIRMPDEDVLVLLTREHRVMEALLKNLLDTRHGVERAALLAKVSDRLALHMGVEESVFYPAVSGAGTLDILLESLEEHLSLRRLLSDLLMLPPADGTFRAKCKVLHEQTEHHHGEEEDLMFPLVLLRTSEAERRQLGRLVRIHEQRLLGSDPPRQQMQAQTAAAQRLAGEHLVTH